MLKPKWNPHWTPKETEGAPISSTTRAEAPHIHDLAVIGFILAFVIPPAAIFLGDKALTDIKKSHGALTGRGLAVAAKTLGYIGTAVWVLYFFSWMTSA